MNETITLDACRDLLRYLNNLQFPFSQLRPKPLTLEECFVGDYDFLYDGKKKSELIKNIILFLKDRGISFVILRNNQYKLQVRIFDYNTSQSIILEFWSVCVIRAGFKNIHFSSVITWKDLEQFISQESGAYKIHPNLKALIYVTHLRAKNKNLKKIEVIERLKYFKEYCMPRGPVYDSLIDVLEKLATEKDDLATANKRALVLLKNINCYMPSVAILRSLNAKLDKLFSTSSPRNIIAVVGPDGSGKTTILKKSIRNDDKSIIYYKFKDLYRKHNGIDKLIRKCFADKNLKRNQLDERFSGIHFLSSRIVFFFFKLIHWKRLIVLDRYFYDLFLTGIRDKGRKGKVLWWYKFGIYLAPRPLCLLILDVPYEIAKNRKDEISKEDWDLIFNNYVSCYFSKPSRYLAYCSTDTEISKSVSFFNYLKVITLK